MNGNAVFDAEERIRGVRVEIFLILNEKISR